ncbi:MAG: ABC transporter ATP-binding protein [Candidatus Cloacimonetes bacterium]|nr:ABC transporter ATP-binding protein [Candidatus Cloacimonadota bacterium]
MRPQMYGSEDDLKAKVYDSKLFTRLVSYLKPYRILVLISFILLFLIATAELALPYVTKMAVDRLITSNTNLLQFDSRESARDFIATYKSVIFKEYSFEEHCYLLFSNNRMNYISKLDLELLQQENRLVTKIVLLNRDSSTMEIISKIDHVIISDNLVAVPALQLSNMRKEGLISLRQLQGLRRNDMRQLKIYGVVFFSIIALQFVFTYFQIFTINYAAQHAMYDLRRQLFTHLQKMPLSFFDRNPVGRLVTRITNDVGTMDEMLSAGLIKLIQDLLVMLGILVMMLVLNWKLALVTFTILPFLITLLIVFKNKIMIVYRIVRKRLAAINASLSEDISGVKIIQLFNQYLRKKKEFAEVNERFYKASMRQMRIYASFRPVIHSLRRVAIAIIIWFGLGQVMNNVISLGIFMAFLSYMDRFFEPIDHLSEKFNILQAAMAGAERIFDLMDHKPEDYRETRKSGMKLQGDIEFRNVWLRYNEDGDVLRNISFRIKAGEKVALVGHTGSGKTSIISLIAGLYPYQKGEIFIDGRKIDDYSLEELRDNIGIVQQDVFLFTGTVRDNIVLSNNDITREEMEKVARYVNVHDFIDNLPGKYLEQVMERGATFSVGQRQLIAFARVLAYDPAIFVLDEATSNIDTETEILIQDALKKLMENRTSIIIAHRLSTIQNVDRIIVMHKGEIREEGSHQELLEKKGLYYDLYRLQYT